MLRPPLWEGACFRSHELPAVRVTPGCKEMVKLFMEAARHRRAILPARLLWGHFELEKHYPFTRRADIAHLEPNDVTCITPGYNRFEHSLPRTRDQTILSNELLCTIRHSPLLGGKVMVADRVARSWQGSTATPPKTCGQKQVKSSKKGPNS